MQVSLTSTSGLERRLEVAVPAARVAGEVDSRLKNLARTVRLKGFRPGKAPFTVVRQQYASQVQSEVVSDLLQQTFSEAVSQEKLRPAGGPRIESLSADPGADLRYAAVFEVMPDLALQPLDALAIESPEATITEADIDAMIESMRRQRPTFADVQRTAQDTDRVTVDFEGRIDGATFAGGTASGINFIVGAGRMLAEFDAGVKGAKAGEVRNVTVHFPADYGSKDVAGKMAVFAVTVQKVEEQGLPAVDDEFCSAFGVREGGLAKLREEVRDSMQRELSQAIRSKQRLALLDALHSANPLELPRSMVDEQVQELVVEAARRMGVQDVKQLPAREAFEETARRRVALGLIVGEIIRMQGIKVDRERVNARLAETVSSYPNSDEMRRQYLQNADAMRDIEAGALEDQVIDVVLAKAKVTTKPSTFSELTGFGQNASRT
jgi:trigger factor